MVHRVLSYACFAFVIKTDELFHKEKYDYKVEYL